MPAAAQAGPLRLGFTDREFFQTDAIDRDIGLQRTRALRASLVRLATGWREIATSRPPTRALARDPAWPGYSWGSLDAAVIAVASQHRVPVLSFTGAPDWAEGRNRPRVSYGAQPGTWKPSGSAYRDFAEAAARRYSGHFQGLPAVRYLEAWNEPNLVRYLSPQWQRRKGKLVPVSPASYRSLQNGFYNGVKAGNPRARVITAGTAPFGDPVAGGFRMPPAFFWRQVFKARVKFDVLAHHPYSTGSPSHRAINPDDVAIPDLGKLTRPLRKAIRKGKVLPRRSKPLWITEVSWDTKPPDPDGVPAGKQARWVEGAFYKLWRQGVDAIVWFHLRDEARGDGYPFTYQSGVYQRGPTVDQDSPKPAVRAFRFPFTAYRSKGVARLWGIAPKKGKLEIQVRSGGSWKHLATVRAKGGRIFSRRLPVARGKVLRAVQGNESSLTWGVS
jgi:hypothetical protein